jgi:hypothetical protein
MTNDQLARAAFPTDAIQALRRGNKIEAIKLVRLARNIGLKEAKDAVEDYLRAQPALLQQLNASQAQGREGFVRWLVVILLVLAAGTYLYFKKS